jgi:putative ABC transport system permease protein
MVLDLALKSLWNRRGLAMVTILSIALSVILLLGVEKVREGTKAGFAGTVSSVDIIMGARSGGLQLMLYSVFRIGDAPNNFSWDTFESFAERPEVDWIIPLSLGDSHRGYRVVGTDNRYFEHFRYRDQRPLEFAAGGQFEDMFDTVLGSTVASQLGYAVGDAILINHGLGTEALAEHVDRPFVVSGILEPTGTPVDRGVHIGLAGIEALHVNMGAPVQGVSTVDQLRRFDLQPTSVTAALMGLKTPLDSFAMQREISQFRDEPLTAVLPGFGLLELWSILEIAETALRAISTIVVAVAAIGMATTLVAMLSQRRQEMAILRSVGASPAHISLLLLSEALLLALVGAACGVVLTFAGLIVLQPWIDHTYGLYLRFGGVGVRELGLMGLVVGAALVAGIIPAVRAYQRSVADGISPVN